MIVNNTVEGSGIGNGFLGEISVTFCGATESDLIAPWEMMAELKRRMRSVFMANSVKV